MNLPKLSVSIVKVLSLSCILALAVSAEAAQKSFKLDGVTVSLDLPAGWKSSQEMYGLEVTVVGPVKKDSRPALSVTDLKIPLHAEIAKEIEKHRDEYKAGKEKWLVKRQGKLLEIQPPTQFTHPTGGTGYRMSSRFVVAEVPFAETTYLFECGKRLFHLKTMVRTEIEKDFASALEKLVQSFRCGG